MLQITEDVEKMKNSCFDGRTAQKIVFHFIDHDRTVLAEAEVGSETCVFAVDEEGGPIEIPFEVTRSARLSDKIQWIYGKILDVPGGFYYQNELKLHPQEPEADTVEVYLRAPPITFP